MPGSTVKRYSGLGHKLPIAAIDNKTAVLYPIVRFGRYAIGYEALFGIILKHLDLGYLRRTGIDAYEIELAVLAAYHCDRKHAAVHVEVGTTGTHALVISLERKVLHAFENNCHFLGIILVVVRDIVLAYVRAVGIEIVIAAFKKKDCRRAFALGLDCSDSFCKLIGHILTGAGDNPEITRIVYFLASTARCQA